MLLRLLFALLLCYSCIHTPPPSSPQTATTIAYQTAPDTSEPPTILIETEIDQTLEFTPEELETIKTQHPEFFESYASDPDLLYARNTDLNFDSELGKDTYYALYAYFLKQRNGVERFASERQQLITLFGSINALFQRFQYGGTYFGHQYRRILGYAEYSIYLLPKDGSRFQKTYPIEQQKALYIASLRQLVEDELSIDLETDPAYLPKRRQELNKLVDTIERLITDVFYLRRTQEFHHRHYEYY